MTYNDLIKRNYALTERLDNYAEKVGEMQDNATESAYALCRIADDMGEIAYDYATIPDSELTADDVNHLIAKIKRWERLVNHIAKRIESI